MSRTPSTRTSGSARAPQHVAPESVPWSHFCWERVKAGQCIRSEVYTVRKDSEEEAYFLDAVQIALKDAAATDHEHPLVKACAVEDVGIKSVKHAQLDPVAHGTHYDGLSEPYDDSEYKPVHWEMYPKQETVGMKEYTNWYVVSPVLHHDKRFRILHHTTRDFKFELECDVLPEGDFDLDGKYGIRIQLAKVPRAAANDTLTLNSNCLKIDYGHYVRDALDVWATAYVKEFKPFTQSAWPVQPEPAAECEDEEVYQDKVENREGRLVIWKKSGKDNWTTKPLLSFAIDGIRKIYKPLDGDDANAITEFDIHRIPAGSTVRIYERLRLQLNKCETTAKLRKCINAANYQLWVLSTNFEAIADYIAKLPSPEPTFVPSYFGRQPDGFYVLKNVAFKEGQLYTHEEANVELVPEIFKFGVNERLPLDDKQQPQMFIVQDPATRYGVFKKLWTEIMPDMFGSNEMNAKAAFALTVMHLHSSMFWNKAGGIHGVPCGWLFSAAAGTGKTRTLDLCKAFLGLYRASLWGGGFSSMPALVGRLGQTADMTLPIDEMCTKYDVRNKDKSTLCKDLVHTIYDQTVRGKLLVDNSMGARKPLSSFITTSNHLINESDSAFQQRLIVLHLQGMDSQPTHETTTEWPATEEVVSCLLPDLEAIGCGGELDAPALKDCAMYASKLGQMKYSRCANMYGYLLYYLLNLTYLATDDAEALRDVFKWFKLTFFTQHTIADVNVDHLAAFVVNVHQVFNCDAYTHSPDQCIFWHNYRTTQLPTHAHLMYPGQKFIAIRVGSCILAVEKRLNLYIKKADINRAIKAAEGKGVVSGKAKFWNTHVAGWPPSERIICEVTNEMKEVPLAEEKLLACNLVTERCVFIEKGKYDEMVDTERELVVPEEVGVIESAREGQEPYDLVTAAEARSWYGFRGAKDIEIHEFRDSPPVSPQSVLHKFGYELRDVTNLQERPNSKRGLSFDSCAEALSQDEEDMGSNRGKRTRDDYSDDLMDEDEESEEVYT